MPKDSSIRSVLLIGSGPIIIGQACEPACRQAGSTTAAADHEIIEAHA